MFLLDTDVVSELRRPQKAQPRVVAWAQALAPEDMFISSVSILELEVGALLLARRDPAQGRIIRQWIENRVLPAFAGRVIAVDTAVALRCAALHVPNPKPYRDSLIAASALVHGLTVATRNSLGFESMPVDVVNPWN